QVRVARSGRAGPRQPRARPARRFRSAAGAPARGPAGAFGRTAFPADGGRAVVRRLPAPRHVDQCRGARVGRALRPAGTPARPAPGLGPSRARDSRAVKKTIPGWAHGPAGDWRAMVDDRPYLMKSISR